MRTLKRLIILAALAAGIVVPLMPQPAHAGGATLYLSPGRKSLSPGQSIAVAVRVNAGEPVNAVQADLSYPAGLLDFVSISEAGSAFGVAAQSAGGGGAVYIGRGNVSPVSGDRLVATVYFRARTTGTATVSFMNSSYVVRASDNTDILSGRSGGTYSLVAPAPKPAPKPGAPAPAPRPGAPAPAPAPGEPAPVVQAPPPDRTPPVISKVRRSDLSHNSITIHWKTDEAATSVIEYGLSNKYGFIAEVPGRTRDHKVTLAPGFLVPQVKYHFRIKSIDGAGNPAVSQDFVFTTLGYPAIINLVDEDGNPIEGALVTVGNSQATTTAKGRALIRNLTLGRQLVVVSYRGASLTSTIEIKEGETGTGKIQSFRVMMERPPLNLTPWLPVLGLALILLLLVARWLREHIKRVTLSVVPNQARRLKDASARQASVHLAPHEHTGKLTHHRHTSYAPLFFLTLIGGLMLAGVSMSALADQNAVSVNGRVLGPPPTRPAIIETPRNGARVSELPVEVAGTCQFNLVIAIMRGSDLVGAGRCSTSGRFRLAVDLRPGQNTLRARTVDFNGQTGPDSPPVDVFFAPPAGVLAPIAPIGGGDQAIIPDGSQVVVSSKETHHAVTRGEESDWNLQVSGGRAPYAVTIDWGDGRSDTASLEESGGYYARHIFTKSGTHPVKIKVVDADGRVGNLQLFAIVDDPSASAAAGTPSGPALPGWLLVAWPLYVLIFAMLLSFWLGERYEKRVLTDEARA